MIFKSKNFNISAVKVGEPLVKYPVWFHRAVSEGKIKMTTGVVNGENIVKSLVVKNVYGGSDTGKMNSDYICKGVKNEVFLMRDVIFNAMFIQEVNK